MAVTNTRAPSATTILKRARTRTELRAYVLSELPGWGPWLDLTAAELQCDMWDNAQFKTEAELLEDIRTFAAEFVAGLGSEAEVLFKLFLQQAPDGPLHQDQPAIEPFTHDRGEFPFSHYDLRQRMPSRTLLGLVGALGLRRHWTNTGRIKAGRTPNIQLTKALEKVRESLFPFVKTPSYAGARANEVVAPERHHWERGANESSFRKKPLSVALVAVVAIYLGLPNRRDPELRKGGMSPPADPERFTAPGTLHEETMARLRAMMAGEKEDAAKREQQAPELWGESEN